MCVGCTLEMDDDAPTAGYNFQFAVASMVNGVDYLGLFKVFGLHYPTGRVFRAIYEQSEWFRRLRLCKHCQQPQHVL